MDSISNLKPKQSKVKKKDGKIGFSLNETFPDVPFVNLNGDTIFIKTDKKFILLDFWYIGCAPCKKAIPVINGLQNEYPQLQIIGINSFQKNTSDIQQYIKKSNIQFDVLLNTQLACNFLHPAFVLLDSNMQVVKILYGFTDANMRILRDYISSNSN